jgi:chromosome segregation ATPase
MNVKEILLIAGVSVSCSLFGGCATAGPAGRSVTEHTREVIELENANRELQERIDKYDSVIRAGVGRLENLGERAAEMGGTVDELIDLFGQYQRGVSELRNDYRELKESVGQVD